MCKFTVFGGRGFIGSEVVRELRKSNHEVYIPERNDENIFKNDLGTIIYAAGNGDCITTPYSVFEANTELLSKILRKAKFSRLVYLSSTRLYMNQDLAVEEQDFKICVADKRKLFNLTKLVSEELCLLSEKDVVIIRPSNVYGIAINSPLFLPSITRNAINNGQVDMYVSPAYSKDYVSVSDVSYAVCTLAQKENLRHRIYNVASGNNTLAVELAEQLKRGTNCSVLWHSNVTDETFPEIDISKLKSEIHFEPSDVVSDLSMMIENFKKVI